MPPVVYFCPAPWYIWDSLRTMPNDQTPQASVNTTGADSDSSAASDSGQPPSSDAMRHPTGSSVTPSAANNAGDAPPGAPLQRIQRHAEGRGGATAHHQPILAQHRGDKQPLAAFHLGEIHAAAGERVVS